MKTAHAAVFAFYGHGWPVCRKCRSNVRRWPGMAGTPEMQEQFPVSCIAGMPEMQEHFPAMDDRPHRDRGKTPQQRSRIRTAAHAAQQCLHVETFVIDC